MAEAAPAPSAAQPGPPPLDPDSVWTKIQRAGISVPADVIDKLAELDLELSEGEEVLPVTAGWAARGNGIQGGPSGHGLGLLTHLN